MAYEINVDKYAFAETPQPEKVNENFNEALIRILIDKETEKIYAADKELEQSILNEVCARTDEDADLKLQMDNEALARENAVQECSTRLEEETTQRKNQDEVIISKLEEETTQRENQDNAIILRLQEEAEQRRLSDTSFLQALDALEAAVAEEKEVCFTAHEQLTQEINLKANTQDVYTKEYIDSALDGKSDKADVEAMETKVQELSNIKEDAAVILTDSIQESISFNVLDMHNKEYRCLLPLTALALDFTDDVYPENYISAISFDSPEVPTEVGYPDSTVINWVGTDCIVYDGKSLFQPSSNTHYEVVLYFNGVQFIGIVNGFVPAAGSEAA